MTRPTTVLSSMPSRTITLVLLFVLCALLAQAQTHRAGRLDANDTGAGISTLASLPCRNYGTIRCIDSSNSAGWAGSDVGAWFNSAAADCGGNCTIRIAAGTLNYSIPLNFAMGGANGVSLEGAGTGATVLNYIGSPSTPAIQESVTARARISKLSLTSLNTSGVGIQLIGLDNGIEDVRVSGFGTAINVTGSGSPSYIRSNVTRILNVRCDSTVANFGTCLAIDHAIDTDVINVSAYGTVDNTTSSGVVIDTGATGTNLMQVHTGFGRNGLRIQNTIAGGSGLYAISPIYIKIESSHFDTTDGGDACKLDSTLGGSQVRLDLVDVWCSAAGMNSSGTVTTAAAVGLNILGGTFVKVIGGEARFNALHAIQVNNSSTNHVSVMGTDLTGNNQSNNATGCGFNVVSASANISFIGVTSGNVGDTGGHQRYGGCIAAVKADMLRIEDSDLANNLMGPLSNSSTGTYWIWGNTPMAGPTANVVWGDTIIGGTGRFHLGATPFSALGTPADGTVVYCSDCNPTCTAGGSTGRTCFRENGAWTH